jgi:hypothetical protein
VYFDLDVVNWKILWPLWTYSLWFIELTDVVHDTILIISTALPVGHRSSPEQLHPHLNCRFSQKKVKSIQMLGWHTCYYIRWNKSRSDRRSSRRPWKPRESHRNRWVNLLPICWIYRPGGESSPLANDLVSPVRAHVAECAKPSLPSPCQSPKSQVTHAMPPADLHWPCIYRLTLVGKGGSNWARV